MPEVRHWFYPVNPQGNYRLEDTHTGRDMTTSPDNLLINAEKAQGGDHLWHLASGYRMMKRDDVIWIYVTGIQEICALARVHDVLQREDGWHVQLGWNVSATRL